MSYQTGKTQSKARQGKAKQGLINDSYSHALQGARTGQQDSQE